MLCLKFLVGGKGGGSTEHKSQIVMLSLPRYHGRFCSVLQVLFDHVGFLKKYETAEDILQEFYELRLRYYGLRKDWLTGMLGAESAKLNNQARFILEKIEGIIVIGK